MTFKGYEYLNKAMKGDLEPKTIIKTEHKKQFFDDFTEYDYYIYHNDGMFHRCSKSGKLGAKFQDRFLNYKVLNKDFEFYCVLADEEKELEKLGKIDDNDGYIDQNDVIKIAKKVDEIIDKIKELEKNKSQNITITTSGITTRNPFEPYVYTTTTGGEKND